MATDMNRNRIEEASARLRGCAEDLSGQACSIKNIAGKIHPAWSSASADAYAERLGKLARRIEAVGGELIKEAARCRAYGGSEGKNRGAAD